MASPSEHLFSNMSWSALKKSPKLLKNLGFLIFAFVAIRVGSYIPVVGIDNHKWSEMLSNSPFAQMGFPF